MFWVMLVLYHPLSVEERKGSMTRKQNSAAKLRWKEELKQLLAEDRDLLKGLIQEALQQVLEAEMDEGLQAEKGERTAGRLGYRSGHYSRMLVTRVGKIELRVPQDRQGRFRTEVFERYQRSEKALVTAWRKCMCKESPPARSRRSPRTCAGEFSASIISRFNEKLDPQKMDIAAPPDGRQQDLADRELQGWMVIAHHHHHTPLPALF